MATDCSNVPTNVTYDCANPWGQGCKSDQHFHFPSLWKYTQNIQKACPNDTRLFLPHGGIASPRNASLTQASCVAIAGPEWKYYPPADIWTRLTAWKFPLFQLVATFPRPPLSFSVECFVIIHLLGDPVDTIKNLLHKMSSCQNIARHWRAECEKLLEKPPGEDEDRDWKALAILTDAYGEWNVDGEVKQTIQQAFEKNPQYKKSLAKTIRQTGRALAADRSTKFLPIIVAQAFFIGAVGIAVFRTASAAGESASSDTVFINVEAHSIAFSALYFWIIPAVFIGSIVGVSQTEAAIPRILRRFEIDVDRLVLPNEVNLPNHCLDDSEKRIFHGGIYSWQPQHGHPSHYLFSYLIVIMGTATGLAISALVPPDGWDCRHYGEILVLLAWLLSALIDIGLRYLWPLNKENQTDNSKKKNQAKLFWSTGLKDLLVTIATIGGIITVQLGIFNKCECYTLWGKTGLALPEMPDTAQTLFDRLTTVYPAIAFTSIAIQLVLFPLFISIRYKDALRTFVQRDDRRSHALWLWKILKKYRASKAAIQSRLSRFRFSLPRGNRTNTMLAEEGSQGNSQGLQPFVSAPKGTATGNNHADGIPVADGQPGPTDLLSQSSAVDWPSRSWMNLPSTPDPRRINTL